MKGSPRTARDIPSYVIAQRILATTMRVTAQAPGGPSAGRESSQSPVHQHVVPAAVDDDVFGLIVERVAIGVMTVPPLTFATFVLAPT